jgi:peptidoglycan/LPS O-acetylase OafA/YrhL/lysophospholipase L1-like esterase
MPALDGLRACAVLAVLCYHGELSWARGGYFGVDAFFVLSGFLITSLLLAEWDRTRRIDLKAFWGRRARRLLPALVLVLAAVAAYAALFANPIELHQLRRDAFTTFGYVANWNQIFSHQSYFQSFAAPSPLKHAWSLAIEEQFYLVWPLCVFALLRLGRGSRRLLIIVCGVLAAASALLMAVLYQPHTDPTRVYYGTDTRAQSLLIGALLAALLTQRRRLTGPRAEKALRGASVLAIAGLAFIWMTTSEGDGWQYRGGFALAGVLVAIVIAAVTRPSGRGVVARALSSAPLRAIGLISYGLYLWHWPLYVVLTRERTGLDGARLFVFRLALTFAVAIMSFFCVEQPIRRGAWPRWSVRVLAPVATAGVAAALLVSTSSTVPPAFRDFTAAQITPPAGASSGVAAAAPRAVNPSTSSTAPAPPPLRVMVVGDSVAHSMAPGLERLSTANSFTLWDTSVPGCGLATDVGDRWFAEWQGVAPQCLPGWRERWPEQITQFHPDLVVMLVGAQDAFDRRIDGHTIRFDTPEGEALAEQDLQDAINVLTTGGARVVMLTTPYYVIGWPQKVEVDRSPLHEPWINRYNDLQRTIASRNASRVHILDLNHYVDPAGTWTDTVDGIKVRAFDRCHLSDEGADFVARWLTPQLLQIGRRNASATSVLVSAASAEQHSPTGPVAVARVR